MCPFCRRAFPVRLFAASERLTSFAIAIASVCITKDAPCLPWILQCP
jgi:hypothetical protein